MAEPEMQFTISCDEPAVLVEVVLRGQGYNPDVANDIKRRAVDAFRDALVILNDYIDTADDEEEEEAK